MSAKIKSLAIIGKGKVGLSLAQLAKTQGYQTKVIGRDVAQQKKACKGSDLIIISVNDDAIKEVAKTLSPNINKSAIVTHCSGALSSDELSDIKQAAIASCHPLNTFPSLESSLKTFSDTNHGSYLFAEGTSTALTALKDFYSSLGFKFRTLDKQAKIHYHLACSIACNYLSVLMHSSLNIAEAAGLKRDEFRTALLPLVRKTLDNVEEFGSLGSLSGPIARGDIDTVSKHQEALSKANSNIQALYTELGKIAADMAREKGQLGIQEHETFINTLVDCSTAKTK